MGRTRSTHGGEKECIEDFGGKARRDHYEDLDVGGRIILKWILERQDEMVWTGLIWLRIGTSGGPLVNTVMNLLVP
jgi:hypothetical protein